MGKHEIGRNGKRAGQMLGGIGNGRSWKGQKTNGRNGENFGEMGMGEMGLGKLGINLFFYMSSTFLYTLKIAPSICHLLRREDCDNWKTEDDSKSNGDCSLLLPEYGEL